MRQLQVIIIYEPTVGSLLSKGLQRLGGTVFAIVLSLICSEIAENSGRAEVYLIPVFLYLGAHVLGFLRQVLFTSSYEWASRLSYKHTEDRNPGLRM